MADIAQKKIAVIGSGLIGRSFAMLFAVGGYKVVVYDVEPAQTKTAKDDIWKQLTNVEAQGLLRGKLTIKEQFDCISTTESLEDAVQGAFFVQECVPERLDIKRDVWQRVDKLVGNDVIMASSASALMPSKIADGLEHKNRFLVSHPVNPPYYIPAIEVVPSSWTDPEVVEKTMDLLREVGQKPVLVKKEVDGFVLNRLQYAIIGEAYNLIQDGVVSPEDLDTIMSDGMGLRYAFMGPLETAYLNADGLYSYRDRYADMIHRIQQSFKKPEKMNGETLKIIHNGIAKVAGPVEDLPQRRQWRDKRMIGLAKLKMAMDKEDQVNGAK